MILALSADGKALGFGGRGRQMTPLVTGSASAWEAAGLPLNGARDGTEISMAGPMRQSGQPAKVQLASGFEVYVQTTNAVIPVLVYACNET